MSEFKSVDQAENLDKKRRWWLWPLLLMALPAIGISLLLFNLFGNSRDIQPSKSTTVITGPLDKQGGIDYLAYLNKVTSAEVTPAENAVVDYYQLLGSQSVPAGYEPQVVELLGVDPFHRDGPLFVPYEDWLQRSGAAGSQEDWPDRPWKATEYSELSQWLADQDDALDQAVLASQKPGFYLPLISPVEPPSVVGTNLQFLQDLRGIVRGVRARGLRSLDSGDSASAKRDADAILDMSRQVAHAPSLIGQLVSIAIEKQGLEVHQAIIQFGGLTPEELKRLAAELMAWGTSTRMLHEIDESERFMVLDAICKLRTQGANVLAQDPTADPGTTLARGSVNWNRTLETVNHWYDELIRAGSVEAPQQRRIELQKVENSLGETAKSWGIGWWIFSRNARSQLLGDIVCAIAIPSLGLAMTAEINVQMKRELIAVLALLEAYRLGAGEYPESLDKLSPELLDAVPEDRYRPGTPIQYRRDTEGVTLWSVGSNLVDDGAVDHLATGDIVVTTVPASEPSDTP